MKCSARGIRCSGYGVRYRFKTEVRVSEKSSSTCESKYDQKLKASRFGSESSEWPRSGQIHCPSEDDDAIVSNESCSTPARAQVFESTASVICRSEEFGNDGVDLTDDSMQSRMDEEAIISSDLILRPQKPWKQYLLNYCESDAEL